MDDLFWVDILQSQHDTGHNELFIKFILTCLFFCEKILKTKMISQISSSEVLHCEIEVFSILEGLVRIDDEGIAHLVEEGLFVDYWSDTLFHDDPKSQKIYLALDISFMA